ncbi:MAG: hypothetical protein K2M84_05985 [Anaeroplasmataceae bacterium]|nr:hypothetical protein [Anaeroplasmataceae bacterium]
MKTWKKILQWFINPKLYFLIPIMVIAIGTTISGTIITTQSELNNYIVWGFTLLGIAGVTISYSIYAIIKLYPKTKENILIWAENHPRINRIISEYGVTTLILTAASMIVTFAFAVYNGSIAIVIRSIWFGALAAYYIVLILLRGSILIYYSIRKKAVDNGQSETQTLIHDGKLYRACGIMLFLLPICLSFAILQMVRAGDSFEHKGITIYVYAIYAFFKIITAIYSLIKHRHNKIMMIMAIKYIKLADAFVSILALQTAMFREFAVETQGFDVILMNAITGAVICALTVAVGVYMIIRANLIIKRNSQI